MIISTRLARPARIMGLSLVFLCTAVLILISPPAAKANAPVPFTENFTAFTGAGFASTPAAGQLDSDYWRVTGLSDGAGTFGGTHTSGDFARGGSNGGVTTGGVYAFNTGSGNIILGVQPVGDDFTPGTFSLRLQNTTGGVISALDIAYDIWYRNDQPRGNNLNFAYSTDDVAYTAVPTLNFATPDAADALGWQSTPRSTTITGLNIANGASFYLQWQSDDATGSGSRDELGIDNVQVTAGDTAPSVSSVSPTDGAVGQAVNVPVTATFSEAVSISGTVEIACTVSGTQNVTTTTSDNLIFTLPHTDFDANDDCTVTISANQVTDNDTDDPPNEMAANFSWTFSMYTPPVTILINEVDSDTPGTDAKEFIELYDGGVGNSPLDGLVVVLFNGSNDQSYASFDLDGYSTDAAGYFVLGNTAVSNVDLTFANNTLQNGADAVALYTANAADFPNGTAVTTTNLLDALVYGINHADDTGLLPLLNAAQLQINEDNGPNDSPIDANLRCPNGSGGLRNSSSYNQNSPTPGFANISCSCTAPVTAIGAVQGSGLASPLNGSSGITVRGTVVGDFPASTQLNGFFIQDLGDGNAATSDGLFIYIPPANPFSSVDVTPGQQVEITGRITEFNTLTEMDNVTALNLCGLVDVAPTAVTLPNATSDSLEPVEGMLVNYAQTLTATEVYQLGRYGEVMLSPNGRMQIPTQVALPGAPANAVLAANLLNFLILDDGSTTQNPDPIVYPAPGLSAANTLRVGATVTDLTGVISYGFSFYRLHPTITPNFVAANPRTAVPDTVGGTVRVAGFNVLNYFNGNGAGGGFPTARGAESLFEFNRQRDKIISALVALNADIVGLMEIENDGYGATSAIADLVNGLNAATAPNTYAYVDPGTGTLGSDEIAVGFIYKPGVVTLIATATDDTAAFADRNRQPLAATFSDNGETFTVVVNHFKSKGSACDAASGVFPADPDTGDGQGNCNITRTLAAQQLVNWLATDPTTSGDPDFLIIGDLNSYAMEDPITAIRSAGYTNLQAAFTPSSYTYVFGGQSGQIDYALSSPTLTGQVTGATAWHINADEPISLDYNDNFKSAGQIISLYAADAYRASDHDPVLIGLNLGTTADYSDLSYTYGTAWHTGNGAVRLGGDWTADTIHGLNADNSSDDGVTIGLGSGVGGQWQPGANGGSLNITVTGSGNGCLYGWIDWNNDGLFNDDDDAGNLEYIIRGSTSGSGNYTFAVPAGEFDPPPGSSTPPQTYNLRVRLYAACASGPTGGAVGGEVEDYVVSFTPTAVSLQAISTPTTPQIGMVILVTAVLLTLIAAILIRQRRRQMAH